MFLSFPWTWKQNTHIFHLFFFLSKLNSKREKLDPDVQRALLDRSTTVVFLVNEVSSKRFYFNGIMIVLF